MLNANCILIGLVIILFVFYLTSSRENFQNGYSRRVRLNDVYGGVSSGYAYLELAQRSNAERYGYTTLLNTRNPMGDYKTIQNNDLLNITIEANIPYIHGGDFNTLRHAQFDAYLFNMKTQQSHYLGPLVRSPSGDHMYRLRTRIPYGVYRNNEFNHISVVKNTAGYEPKTMLEGAIDESHLINEMIPDAFPYPCSAPNCVDEVGLYSTNPNF